MSLLHHNYLITYYGGTYSVSVGDRLRRHEAGPRRHRRARLDGSTLPVDLIPPRRHLHVLPGLPQQVADLLRL